MCAEGTSEVVKGEYGSSAAELVYGVFTTPVNSIGGSAVCAFSMSALMRTFDGDFKEQSTMNANWLRVPPNKVNNLDFALTHTEDSKRCFSLQNQGSCCFLSWSCFKIDYTLLHFCYLKDKYFFIF